MKKRLKIYLHHSQYEPVSYKGKSGILAYILNIFYNLFYGTGMIVLTIITLPWELIKAVAKAPKTIPIIFQKLHTVRFQKTVAVFIVLAILAGGTVHSLNLIAAGLSIKGEVLGESTTGLGYLKDAQSSLESQNSAAAQVHLGKALEQFKNSRETLNSTSLTLKGLLAVVPQKRDADKLLFAAAKITEAGIKGTELITLTEWMKLSAVGLTGNADNKELLLRVQTLLNESVALADEAAELINDVSIGSLPEDYRPAFIAAQDTANLYQQNVSTLKEVSSLVFDLLIGSKNILLVFQNNNELRASGGFMGTIGNAQLSDGSIAALDIRSVYDWDGQLKEKILPPQPLYAVNNRWFLRDSNWFADFPQSASRITALYEKEGGETPDLIITMTPEVILDMLDRTGPVELPQHGVTLNKENFIEVTQQETSINYDKTANQPKQFLADFFPLLMERLGSKESGGAMAFLEIFQQNLYKKQILLFSREADIQEKILAFNWGGELRETDRDYLSIVNSNLGGTKTDRYLQRSTDLKSTVNTDGNIINELTYTVKNPLPSSEGLTNKSFVRIYVPSGSIISSTEGFDRDIQLPRLDNEGYTLDEQVQEWQKELTQDVNTGTYYGYEAGKSWFGNWLEVGGGQTKTVTVTYQLPFKIGDIDRHSLLVQKQPGTQVEPIKYELNFDGRSSLWNSNLTQVESRKLTYSQNLITDTFIGLVLKAQ